VRLSPWLVAALVLLAVLGALVTYKASGSLATIERVESTGQLLPKAERIATAPLPVAMRPLARAFNYLAIVWPALVFGVLIGATVRALVPSAWLAGLFGGPPWRSHVLGGLAGAPLMLCSCCAAPIFAAIHDRTRLAGPASALLLASPSLNPAALALTFLLFTPAVGWTRMAMATILVLAMSALAARLVPRTPGNAVDCAIETETRVHPASALRAIGVEATRLAVQTLPLIVLGVVASAVLVEIIPIARLSEGSFDTAIVLLVALVAVPIALPTFAEIPLALGLLAAGAPAGAAVALLVAGPAINLPSLLTLRRMTGTRYAMALGAGTFLVAAVGGLLV